MDLHPTPFPAAKTQSVRSKYKNVTEAPKSKPKNQWQKRVFGTIRNTNVPEKPNSLTDKRQPIPRKQPKSVKTPEIKETPVVLLESTLTIENQSIQAAEISVIQPKSSLSPESTGIQSAQEEEIAVIKPESTCKKTEIQSVQEEEIAVIQPESTHKTREIPSIPVVQKEPKSKQAAENTPVPPKESPAENGVRRKKKSVCFLETTVRENASKNDGLPRTPIRSPFSIAKPHNSGTPFTLAKPRLSGTPYQSAEKCSHCRFDKLETSSYWLSQIRLSESVGKHFVSLAFFRLALDSKAEPYRNLRVELKKYLGRHEYLSAETEWKDVSRKYGLLKDDSNEANVTDNGNGDIRDHQEQNKEQNDKLKGEEEEEAASSQSHSESD